MRHACRTPSPMHEIGASFLHAPPPPFLYKQPASPLYTLLATTPKGCPSRDPRKALLCLLFVCVCPGGFSLSLLSSLLYGAEALSRLTPTTSTRMKRCKSHGKILILHFYISFYVAEAWRDRLLLLLLFAYSAEALPEIFSLYPYFITYTLRNRS